MEACECQQLTNRRRDTAPGRLAARPDSRHSTGAIQCWGEGLLLGVLYAALGAFTFALNNVAMRRGVVTGSVLQGMALTVPIGGFSFLVMTVAGELGELVIFPVAALAWLAGQGVVHFVLGRYCNYKSNQLMGVNLAAPVVQLQVPGVPFARYRACQHDPPQTRNPRPTGGGWPRGTLWSSPCPHRSISSRVTVRPRRSPFRRHRISANVAGQITARAEMGIIPSFCLDEIIPAYPVDTYNRYILRAV